MATVSTPLRQPFGILNQSKLRNLDSLKNRQNAITPNSAPNLKRRAASPELSDSENIDPSFFDSSSKRKRAALGDDVSLAKQQRIYVKPNSVRDGLRQQQTTTPTAAFAPKVSTTPVSAPAAAGRSPTRSYSQREKLQPRRRFVPPSIRGSSPSLSLAAALRGTVSQKRVSRSKRSSSGLETGRPKSWSFDIFEESEEQQNYRMSEWTMTQSSAALDISDDESKTKGTEKADRGKENVDPNEMFVPTAPVTRAASAAAAAARAEEKIDAMNTEETRNPLGDLNAADYYGEGLNATSVVLVQDDEPEDTQTVILEGAEDAQAEDSISPVAPTAEDFTFEASHVSIASVLQEDTVQQDIPDWAKRTSLSLLSEPEQVSVTDGAIPFGGDEVAEIEIWESESAKDENEQQEGRPSNIIVGEGESIVLTETHSHEQ